VKDGQPTAAKFCKHTLAVIIARRAAGITAEPEPEPEPTRTAREIAEGMNPAARQQRVIQEAHAANPQRNAHYSADYMLLRKIKADERAERAGMIYTKEEK
jgi:hypothetical protein